MFSHLRHLCAIFWVTGAAAQSFDVSSLSWWLKSSNGSIQVPASVPSQVHLDLLKAGIITEPLLGINDFTQRWIVDDDWTYTADLQPYLSRLNTEQTTLLVFHGLDTVANITIAGHPVAWVNNQFRRYTYDVTSFLADPVGGDHNLTVAFKSAWHYGLNVTSRSDAEFFPTSVRTSDKFEYPGVRQWIRKISSDFGWDWGPAFVPSGIFKPAYLVTLSNPSSTHNAHSNIFIEETAIDVYKSGQTLAVRPDETADWAVNVSMIIRSSVPVSHAHLIVELPELNFTSPALALPSITSSLKDGKGVSTHFSVPEGLPQRWYPWNLASGPKLYNMTITLHTPNHKLTVIHTRTGFRTIFLDQSAYSAEEVATRGITPGDQWHFEINGNPFYALGTNLIPFDPFYARTNPEKVRWVLESAVKSGQNMLRVWGGGTYQPSSSENDIYDFYDICDELGILAWSELIFSDSLYPINDFFLENIEPEVHQQVRRVKRHPSNAQWAGGNENEAVAVTVNKRLANGTHYLNEFVFLFQDFLAGIVQSETHSVPYTDSSTTSGALSLDPYVLRFENGTRGFIYGNGERYNYDASQAFNYSTFPKSRFVNEFGFHSMPSFYGWEEVLTSPEDFSFNSTVVMSRDHHPPATNLSFPNPKAPIGQAQMTNAVELWLPRPGTADANQTFAQWSWSTQIFQTMTTLSQVSFYRRGAGEGEHNLGSLVWQLNDIWQGVSWSSIEYSGRWKVLNYGLASSYTPVVINPFWTPENETLEVVVTSDRWFPVNGTAMLTWYDWTGKVLGTKTDEFTIPPLNNSLIWSGSGLANILPSGARAEDVWLLLNITAHVDGQQVKHEEHFTPVTLARANLVDPEVILTPGQGLSINVSARGGVGAWTWLDHPAGTVGYFVDVTTGKPSNGFFLVPGIDRSLRFVLEPTLPQNAKLTSHDFIVRSLWNNTHL